MFNQIFNLIFPKRCIGCNKLGSYICPPCFSLISFEVTAICPVCNRNSIDGATHTFCKTHFSIDGLSCGVVYKGVVKRMIYKLKYPPYISDLKNAISKLMHESLDQNESFYNILKKKPFVVAVPLYKKRQRSRGYNHADLIASRISRYFNLEFLENVLIRTRDTKPQYKLDKKKRIENMKNAFSIDPKLKEKIKDRSILIIDDLATTCVTLNECAKVLKRNGAKFVWGVVFARES